MLFGTSSFKPSWSDYGLRSLAIYGLTVVVVWRLWRLWRFTIRPYFKSDTPKELPYMIPFVGHAVSMLSSPHVVLSSGIKYCRKSGEPIAVNVLGQIVYFILSEEDATTVLRGSPELTHTEHIQGLLRALGCSKFGVGEMHHASRSKVSGPGDNVGHPARVPFVLAAESLMRKQLLHRSLSQDLLTRTLQVLDMQTRWDGIEAVAVLQTSKDARQKTVSLSKWAQGAMIRAIATAWFGAAIWDLSPTIIDDLVYLDHSLWKLVFRLPRPFAKDVQATRDRLRRCFVKYLRLSPSMKEDQCWAAKASEMEMRTRGMGEEDIACYMLMVFWAINANSFKLVFWLCAHICSDPVIYRSLTVEVDSITSKIAPQESLTTLSTRLERSALLEALYNETHRITINTSSARTVLQDVTINGRRFEAGGHIIVPYRQLAMSHPSLAEDWDLFRPARFLLDPTLGRSRSFLPFGGGKHKCFGRFLTRRIVLTFTALVVQRFAIQPLDGIPEMCFMPTSAGPAEPAEGSDMRLLISPRPNKKSYENNNK